MNVTDENFTAVIPPPPGVVPNFVNPESIGYRLVIVAIVFPVITGVFLILRLYTAAFILRRWHVDDYSIIIAFLLAVADSVTHIIQTHNGGGTHMWEVSKVQFREFSKIGAIAGPLFYHLSTLFAKFSILSFYLRFSSANRAFRFTAYFVMFVSMGYTVPMAFTFLFQCRPMAAAWDERLMASARCIDIQLLCNIGGVLNTVTDFTILLLPIWLLRPLRIPLMRKIGVMLILMTGGFVCVISAVRTYTIFQSAYQTDHTRIYVPNLVWFLVEMYFGIICACLPCLKPFMRHHFPSFSVFGSDLESRMSTSIQVVSARVVDTITTRSLGGGRGGGRNHNTSERETRSMSRVGAEVLQSKPSRESIMFGKGGSERGGSSSEGGKEEPEFRGGVAGLGLGEKSSGSTLREEGRRDDGETLSEKVHV